MAGIGDNIIVNDFMFCSTHGNEHCYVCFCDHRMCNNIRIEDELGDMSEFLEFDVEERHPLNAYERGAVPAVNTEVSYQCQMHKEVDCKKCFDWVQIIKKEAQVTEEQGGWLSRRKKWTETVD